MEASVTYSTPDTLSTIGFEGCEKDLISFLRSIDRLEGCRIQVVTCGNDGLPFDLKTILSS